MPKRDVLSTCFVGLLLLSCSDPVHDNAVQSLGPEDPLVGPGPDHRPGQPCLACHGGAGPAIARFVVGGTVYATQGGRQPADRALVQIEDVDGHIVIATTNSAGNFYVSVGESELRYPTQVAVSSSKGDQTSQMFSLSNRDGSCADCHLSPAGPTSPGPVFVYPAVDVGGDAAAP
jgi:hypothetical protein